MKVQLEELQKKLKALETPKYLILDLDSLIENAPEGKLIQVSDETKEKINTKI